MFEASIDNIQKRHVPCAALNSRRSFLHLSTALTVSSILSRICPNSQGIPPAQAARPEGVNRPDLLPKGDVTAVLDLEGWLPSGQEARLRRDINDLEQRTGVRIRVLTQRYPQTPGKAIVDYWGVNADTVVIVADYFGGSGLLKINVGERVYNKLPERFWSLLASKYGGKFFVEKNGEDQAIVQSVGVIRDCLYKGGCKVPP